MGLFGIRVYTPIVAQILSVHLSIITWVSGLSHNEKNAKNRSEALILGRFKDLIGYICRTPHF
jgi:hypothetical protein